MQSNVTPNGSLWQLAPTLALCEWVRPKTLDPEAGFLSFGMLTFRSAASFNLALEAKQLRAFCDWCGQRFQDADLQFFFEAAPAIFGRGSGHLCCMEFQTWPCS
jgi:hypothetical protein